MNSMHGNRQNLWFAVCGTSLSLLLAIAGAWAQSTAPNETRTPAAAAGPKLAEEEFKNIQALKGVPADQVIPSMQFIAASLGVECEYCHVAHAKEKHEPRAEGNAHRIRRPAFSRRSLFESSRQARFGYASPGRRQLHWF